MRITKLGAAALAASLTLSGAALAFADEVMPEDPTVEDEVVETTTTTTAAPVEPTTTTIAAEEPEADGDGDAGAHPENHGAAVSQAARDTPPGPGHGKSVSEVARNNHGHTKPPKQP